MQAPDEPIPTSHFSRLRSAEHARLAEAASGEHPWKRWGPYLSERQWGTVREDYSADGDAWSYFPHEHARSRAYRWGEDGLAGFSDDRQHICLSLALWNGKDRILKERLFGLTNPQGNHGEDVKELYYYLDATPTHSYQRMLYKYPQRPYPYERLVEASAEHGRQDAEVELMDLGLFDDDRYFDVEIEYAKLAPEDILMRVTARNVGPDRAPLHVLPQLWFRNTWSWGRRDPPPRLAAHPDGGVLVRHPERGDFHLSCYGEATCLFCENESNLPRLFGVAPPATPIPYKDAFHAYVVDGDPGAVARQPVGTKVAFHHREVLARGDASVVRVRLCPARGSELHPLSVDAFDDVIRRRRDEADLFFADVGQGIEEPELRDLHRGALAGLLWSKQYYHLDVSRWLAGDPTQPPPPPARRAARNASWGHLVNADVLYMPDKWEYPWYAAWDLAFHCLPLTLVDPDAAKEQLILLTRDWYIHPNGQLPAYEWAFSDANPPVHAWAAWRVFQMDRRRRGDAGDLRFLERVFHRLLLNFTWWVNRKDAEGRNVFEGGFLGMDNVGVFNRNEPLPGGTRLDQADATSWMAMYSLNLLRIALELALHDWVYEDIASKFLGHFLHIAAAMNDMGGEGLGLWDETDGFYYDVLRVPGVGRLPLKVRSMVGLSPMFAVETLEPDLLARLPRFRAQLDWYLEHRPDLAQNVSRWQTPGAGERRLLSLLRGHRLKCLLRRMLDPAEFLSPFGVRSLSAVYGEAPYTLPHCPVGTTLRYEPGESSSGLFGGNSNWRGPIWFPVNYLIIESLQRYHHYYGDDFLVECPVGSGQRATLLMAAQELSRRLTCLFLRDERGLRPSTGPRLKEQRDPRFADLVLFYEYFDAETGAGLGASHQTGWTALIAKLLQPRGRSVAGDFGPWPRARGR